MNSENQNDNNSKIKSTVLEEIKQYVNSEKKQDDYKNNYFVKPIFIFGEKGVGKSHIVNKKVISKLKDEGNYAFLVEANNLEELKDEIYKLTYQKDRNTKERIADKKPTIIISLLILLLLSTILFCISL
jgi:D-arabinose 5-phosphate isomerase GutQ